MTTRVAIRQIGMIIAIMLIGGIGGLIIDRSVLPWLSTQKRLSRFEFLKRAADNVTIVNKTEQITVREDDSLENIVSQPSTAVVTLIARPVSTDGNPASPQDGFIASGVLLTNDGIIATYRSGGLPKPEEESFSAILFDGTVYQARFVGWDSLTNIAFFRIDVSDAPSIALADSDGARVGKKLIAIAHGNQAHQNRYLTGTLDAFDATFNLSGKTVSSSEKWEGVFRMNSSDASVFVGSPVIQYNGEMLGLVGSLSLDNAVQTFIIPSKAVRQSLDFVLSDTVKSGRPVFGAYYLPLTQSLSILRGLSSDHGALIYSPSGRTGLALIAGSAAEKSGLQANDIIVSVGDEEITLENPLPAALMKQKHGSAIELTIMRAEKEVQIPVVW